MSIRRLLFLGLILLITSTSGQSITGVWTTRQAMPVSNSEFGSATILGKIYTAGGYLSENQNALLIYDTRTNQWKRGPDLPHANHHSGVAAVGDKLYVLGGHHNPSVVQIYNPATEKWSTGAPVPTPRAAMATTVLNNKIHLIGGSKDINRGIALGDHEVYDPAKNTWERKASLPTPSEHVFAGELSGKIYVVGGRSRLSNLNATQIYNPQTNTWAKGPALLAARSGMGGAVFEKRLYVFGGEDLIRRQVLSSVERFDPFTKQWEMVEELPRALHGNPAAVSGKFIYVFGGSRFAASSDAVNETLRLSISETPAAPAQLQAKALSASSIELNWQDRSNNEEQFIVQRKIGGSYKQVGAANANVKRYVVSGLTPATQYTFRLFAVNKYAASSASNTATATTKN